MSTHDLDWYELDGELGDAGLPGAGLPNEGWTTSVENRLTMQEAKVVPTVLSDLGDVGDLSGGANGDVFARVGGLGVWATPAGIVVLTELGTTFDGGGDVIPSGQRWDMRSSYAGEIIGYTVLADQTGSMSVGVWKDTYANYPPTSDDLILTMTVSGATKAAVTLETPIPVAAGDCLRLNVGSASNIQRASCQLTFRRTLPWGVA